MKENTGSYSQRLERRYRRFFKVDLVLYGFYTATAAIPIWSIFTHRIDYAVLAFGAASILVVGILGVVSNLRLLRRQKWGFSFGLLATTCLLGSRILILIFAYWTVARQFEEYGFEVGFADFLSEWIVPLTYFLFAVGFYKFFYHMSAFYYSRLFMVERGMTVQSDGAINKMGWRGFL